MNIWGSAWKSYTPLTRRVYGCICITSNRKVLLVKGRQGEKKWSFPKGHRETFDTSPLSCALRELKEETGLLLKEQFTTSKRYRAGEYYVFFLPEEYSVNPKDTREIEEARWVSLDELVALNKNVDVSIFTQELQTPPSSPLPSTTTATATGEMVSVGA
jgi:8-oxo-dGTP pyrophosphatase MutT (NUDIX family)